MTRFFLIAATCGLAACQTTTQGASQGDPDVRPPYPPGYAVAKRPPEQVVQAIPEGVPPENILIADDGCYYYFRGGATYAVRAGGSKLCVERAPVGTPIDLAVTAG